MWLRTGVLIFYYLVIKGTSCQEHPKYEGCYRESRGEVRLKAIMKVARRTMTIQQCTTFCFNSGYKYAAARNGAECHCGDLPEKPYEPPKLPKPDDNSMCNVPCSYDMNANCGGRHAFSLYTTGIKEYVPEIRDVEKLKIGCLEDNMPERILAEHKMDLLRTNSPKRCIAYCRALGYPHAGVQYKHECFCGVANITSPFVYGCDQPCSGNSRLDCGGNWRLMLYSTKSTSVSNDITIDGCYKYDTDLGVVRRTIPNMTPNRCISYCFFQGMPLAHIYNGEECMCSNIVPNKKSRVPWHHCKKPCPGDTKSICGQENYMVTYKTGANGEPSLGKLVSCYFDETGNLLDGPKLNLGNENNIEFCISRCIQRGYAFAGIRNRVECQCTQNCPPRTLLKMVPDYFCSLPCPKAELQNCGGDKYTTLYRTGLSQSDGEEFTDNSGATNDTLIKPSDIEKESPIVEEITESGNNKENVAKPPDESDISIESNLLEGEVEPLKNDPVTPIKVFAGYMGCFARNRPEIQLTGDHTTAERTLTIQQCNSYCYMRGFIHAATMNGSECFCGDLPEENFPQPDDNKLCNIPCLSYPSINCGGRNAYTIYSTGIKEEEIKDIKKLEFGCLSDDGETRLIKEHKADLIKTNSPKRCIAYCKALGYQHAGVQFSIECYCGLAEKTSPAVDGCDMPCSGDASMMCGGNWRMNVYSTGVFYNTMDITLDGCFLYDESSAITARTIYDMTPNKCIAHCFYQSLKYAHIYRNQCLCGNKIPSVKSKVSMFKCSCTCQGDSNHICGGETHMLTYSTGAVGDPILGRLESCYRDENNDLLTGPKLNLKMENSIHFCIARCIEIGFAFAGLRNTTECQCSEESPKRSLMKMVPNDNCNAPCPRIELQNCGAENFLALYRTGIAPYNKRISGAVLPGYQGCFKDNRNEMRLSGSQMTVRSMTAKSCNSHCFSHGFKYAATRDGKECYCGDLEGNIPKADEESFCNVPCTSDITVKCGGKNAYSIYSTGIKDDDIDNLDELEIGCITDSEDIRLIPEHKIDLTVTNTPKRCIAYCRALGYVHAGVQYSLECYCGLARKTSPSVEGCDLPCTGDPTVSCGGHWKANVYSTGITKPTPGISARGCFKYNRTLAVTRKNIGNINPHKCASNCYLQGFPIAFINAGFECLCGKNLPPSHKFRVNKDLCNMTCGNAKCGGAGDGDISYMSAYTTGVIGDPILGKLVGCYKDESNTLLAGPKLNLGVQNSISVCIATCMEKGYAFAGLRNTFECQCSQSSPKRTPVKIVPDYECASPCPLMQLQSCGAPLFTAIHRTGVPPPEQEVCITSITRVNGKEGCGGLLIFSDEFDTLNTTTWQHSVKISGEDAEFVTYTKKSKNVYVENGKLVIKPTFVKDKFVRYGNLDLKGCTGELNSLDCKSQAKSHQILPPLESGQICTKAFNFKYGIITVRAKLPKGDWVTPEFWLKPAKYVYGQGYTSGKMVLVSARGNAELLSPEGIEIGGKLVESGFQVSEEPYKKVQSKMVSITGSEPWSNDFHNYSVTWTDDTVLFYVDGNILSGLQTAYREEKTPLLEEMGLNKRKLWNNGSNLAPFDQEFYLCIGMSVGGIRTFPDYAVSNGVDKPWLNSDMKNRLKFWLNKHNWEQTWSDETKLEVDYIKITAY